MTREAYQKRKTKAGETPPHARKKNISWREKERYLMGVIKTYESSLKEGKSLFERLIKEKQRAEIALIWILEESGGSIEVSSDIMNTALRYTIESSINEETDCLTFTLVKREVEEDVS